MPEIAEVMLISDVIGILLLGRRITNIRVTDQQANWSRKNVLGLTEFNKMAGSTELLVTGVSTRGKFCWIELSNDQVITVQFGMSGNMRKNPTPEYLKIYNQGRDKPVKRDEYLKHCLLEIESVDAEGNREVCYYHDLRRFGRWCFGVTRTQLNGRLAKLGHDPLRQPELSPEQLVSRFRRHDRKVIGALLLDQEAVFAGVGNYIRAEVLYASRVWPFAKVRDLPDTALVDIYRAYRDIASRGYKAGGASLYTYTGINGDKSDFKLTLKIYGRSRDPDDNPVTHLPDRKSPGGRALHWVPEVQTVGAGSDELIVDDDELVVDDIELDYEEVVAD